MTNKYNLEVKTMPYMHNSMAVFTTETIEDDLTRNLAELTAAALGKPYEGGHEHGAFGAQAAYADENGVEYGSSRPPSPPSTGTTTPTLRISPCPQRLWPFVPPPQYGVVEDYTIFRSSYPQDRNMDFIKSLEIKSILTLVETDPTPGYTYWLDEYQIKQGKVTITPNKEAKEGKDASSTSIDSICEALLFAMDGANYPLWIHCNQGRHRTGCVVACLRKVQGMPIEEVIKEYVAYSSPKARPGDIAFIRAFDPSAIFKYAKQTGFIGGEEPKYKHAGPKPLTNVYELAAELASRGRQDSVASPVLNAAVDNISTNMSEVSIGDEAHPDACSNLVRMSSSADLMGAGEQMSGIDPRLLANQGIAPDDDDSDMQITMVDVESENMDLVETLTLHGEVDPTMDPETVAAALS